MNIDRLVASKLKIALKDAGLPSKETCQEEQLRPALLDFLGSLEEIASETCSPFNPFGVLCALQHFIPRYIIEPRAGFEADMQILFNNAAALAFRFSSSTQDARTKFTPDDYKLVAKSQDTSWLDQYSDALLKIHILVSIIDNTLKRLRLLGKGAKATVDLSSDDVWTVLTMQVPPELQQKMSQYDDRVIRNEDILMKHAMPLGIASPESPLKCVVVNPNWAEFRKGNLNPPPVPVVFGMDAFYAVTSLHSDEIIQIFGKRVHVEDLFVFMAALFKPLVDDASRKVRFSGQGCNFVEEQQLIDYVASWAPTIYADCFRQQVFPDGTPCILESFDQSYWQEVVPHMLRFLSHDFASRDSIDYILFRPTRFAYRCDDGTIFLHLGTVIHFFMYLWDEFQKTGQFGEIKGKVFEVLSLEILESINGFKRIWEPGRKLNFPVAGKTGTDVDVFIQRNELAFLISCKSHGINREYELGNGQICWGRSDEAKSWLRFARHTANAISDHCEELKLPSEIKGICPLVCTGWPEYLYEPSQDYFMDDGIPRIATIREIEAFFKSIDDAKAQELLRDPWIIHL